MLPKSHGEAQPLLGRLEEQSLLRRLLDEVPTRGQVLVLHGEPGIGKSRLLLEAARTAGERGMTVLTATGIQSEAHLPFAGLHQLLRPVRERATALPAVHRTALDAAFGLTHSPAPDHFRIAMAALDLLSEVAADAPLLVVVEDAHWLDRPSADVLVFVARRIESDPILLLAAFRDGYGSALEEAGLPERELLSLDDATAAALLDATAPQLTPETRTRVLREAAGNPLALVELPSAALGPDDESSMLGGVALTERLELAFAARAFDLPEATRTVLLVAALNDEDGIGEIVEAASTMAGGGLDLDVVTPAVAAGIVEADLHSIRFRHPLMRSALVRSSGLVERRRAHEALAHQLADQPDRRAWHRAALLSGEHEDVAVELEEAATRARRRGAIPVAVTAMARAADIGEPASRSHRLLAALALAAEAGRRDVVVPLLREARQLDLGELDRARLTWVEEISVTRPLDGELFNSLIRAAEQAGAAGDHDLHADLLWLVAQRAWWVDPGAEVRQALVRAAHRLGDPAAEDPRVVAIHAYADPFGESASVLRRLEGAVRGAQRDPDAARFFGPAALVVGAFDIGNDFLAAAVDGLREQGRLGLLPRLLMLHACVAARLGDWETAITAADEARRLAEEFGDPQAAAPANTAYSLVAAMRGDEETAELMAARAEAVAEPVGANITVAFAQFGRVLAGLAGGRYADAFASANRLFEPSDSAYHPFISSWLIADLAEAGLHVDELEAARTRMEQVEAVAGERPGAWIEIGLSHARALLADPADAGERFTEALALDLARWPFQRARIQLGYGQWLRRQRRIVESRTVLRAARDTFDALGCAPWAEQARRELRASGESSRRRVPEARDHLTAQELQIAQLAAEGLSNREIGQRLFLSHRTIGTHLYKVFPKLGITSRTELGAALAPASGAGELVD